MLPRPLKAHFVLAIRRLLRPIVRQLIGYGVSYSAFNQIIKEMYVEVADQDFPLAYKRQTDSRVALMTGLNRKEVHQLRRRAPQAHTAATEDTVAAQVVIGRWMAGPPYATPDGMPRRLAYESERPTAASFARLVRDLGIDVPVRSVLDELLRVGAVELLPNGDVELRQLVHIPADDAEAKFKLLGSDPAELFTTMIHNIEHPDAPRLQRKVVYDNVGSDALDQLRAEARQVGEDFIRRANTLLASYDRDRHPDAPNGKRMRVVLGAHYFEEECAPPGAPAPGSKKPARSATDKPAVPGRIVRRRR